MTQPILVTGAAGRVGGVGGLVVEALQRRGLPFRAMVRREDERAEAQSAASAYGAARFYAPCRFPARAARVSGRDRNRRRQGMKLTRGINSKGENVSHPEEYDVVVLGSGRARSFAWSLASQGKRVAVVERRNLAGSCPTIACAPSKNVIHGAKVANYFRRGAEFGIAAGDWKVEMPAVRDRKRKMVDGIVALNVNAYRESGAELVKGQGRFVGPRTIEVTADDGTRTLRGEVVVICTGSRARIDPIPGLAESRPMTHIEALELDRVPKHLLVLGGGYVGLELAQALRRFGSRVTVIERADALVNREDRDASQALRELFHDEGIAVRTGTHVERVEGRSGESVRLHATHGMIVGSDLLVATGRTPNTDGIGLETAGIERDDRGSIKVDERLRTTAAGVWAVGDCAGSPQFTHIADDD